MNSLSAIEIRSVTFGYDSGELLFDRYSDNFAIGKIHILTGENGSGKSTFLKLSNGLLQPREGTIALSGSPLPGLGTIGIANRISVSFQNPSHQLCMPTVEKELGLGLTLTHADTIEARIEKALAISGLDHLRSLPPYDLSFAKRKMVSLAITLASTAPIIAWDEPTAGLSQTELRLLPRILDTVREDNRTLLVVSHDIRWWLQYGDTITHFVRGKNPVRKGIT